MKFYTMPLPKRTAAVSIKQCCSNINTLAEEGTPIVLLAQNVDSISGNILFESVFECSQSCCFKPAGANDYALCISGAAKCNTMMIRGIPGVIQVGMDRDGCEMYFFSVGSMHYYLKSC